MPPPLEEEEQELRDVSPVPFVVSDIVRRATPAQETALPASRPTNDGERASKNVKKRARDPKRLDEGVRRPLDLPDKAVDSVRTLVKTAADAVASDGNNKIQLLAAYEAAIGPALKAIIVIPDPHAPESQKRKRKASSSRPQQLTNGSSSWPASNAPPSFSYANTGPSQHHHQQYAQAVSANSTAPSSPHHHHQQDTAEFERLERLALRRRKVEALESISHTAALFLAEFMAFAKWQQGSSPSSTAASAAGGGGRGANGDDDDGRGLSSSGHSIGIGRSAAAQDHGMVYAAAAAGMAASMFHPPAGENNTHNKPYSNRTITEAYLDAINDEDSDSDSSDVSTIANNDRRGTIPDAHLPSEQGEDDVGRLSGSNLDDDDIHNGRVMGKQEGDDDKGGTSPASEVKVEEQ
ncbi:hypothetical protein N0V82_000828 [Gnomoniopsis sp. IMI 355080]|nr:hypothetical protein N0V82_000828 [Gnomoniopsis sp. IMI 355080]